MSNTKRHPCVQCGDLHMRKVGICFACDPAHVKPAPIKCRVCDSMFVRKRDRSHSEYCSITCASAVSGARSKILNAIRARVVRGDLERPTTLLCADCGKQAREYDHRNYLRPFEVVPVCRSCNLKRGPAEDVKEFVAARLGVSVDALPKRMDEERSRREKEWRRMVGLDGSRPVPPKPVFKRAKRAAAPAN